MKKPLRTMRSKTGKAYCGKASFRKMGFDSQLNRQPRRSCHLCCDHSSPLVTLNSFPTEPAAEAALGLTCLLLDSLVKFLNLLVQFFSGVFPILLGFARSFCDL